MPSAVCRVGGGRRPPEEGHPPPETDAGGAQAVLYVQAYLTLLDEYILGTMNFVLLVMILIAVTDILVFIVLSGVDSLLLPSGFALILPLISASLKMRLVSQN